jgi:hypothetical protein
MKLKLDENRVLEFVAISVIFEIIVLLIRTLEGRYAWFWIEFFWICFVFIYLRQRRKSLRAKMIIEALLSQGEIAKGRWDK